MAKTINIISDKYRTFFDKSTDAMLIIENGLFVDCNRAAISMLNYDHKEEMLSLHPHDLSPEYQPDGQASSDKAEKMMALAFKKGAHCFEWVHKRKNGETFPVEVSLTALQGNGTRTIHTVWRDISKRKETEVELLKMQKLKSLSTLAGGIAHDFNNILLGIYGNISLAKSELNEDHAAYPFITGAENSISRATSLANQLLTFARGGDPVRKPEIIGGMVHDITTFSLSGSNITPLFKDKGELWHADVDKGQIEQVISSLVINAKEAMPTGGSLFVELENYDHSDEGVLSINIGKYLKITIRDEGCGIKPDDLVHIFDPYFTTKKAGNGLGLATSFSIVDKHEGCISVDSELGVGSTFSVYLPATVSMAESGKLNLGQNEEPCQDKVRILIVDDEDYVRHITGLMLSRKGYAVETSTNGKDAIEMYKTSIEEGAPFNLLLLDLTIPGGMGGAESIKKFAEIDPNVRAIVFSGYSDNPVMAEYESYGFCGRLTKPFRTKELEEEVKRVLGL